MNINDSGINIFDDDFKTMVNPPVEEQQSIPSKNVQKQAKKTKAEVKKAELIAANDMRQLEQLINERFYQKETKAKPKPKAKAKESKRLNIEVDPDKKERDEQHQKLLMCIDNYRNSKYFSKAITKAGIKFNSLDAKTNEQLQTLVNKVRFVVNNHGSSVSEDFIKMMFESTERTVNKFSKGKINITGLTDNLFQDEQFLMDLERFRLEYLGFAKMDYRIRLVATIFKYAVKVNAINQSVKLPTPNLNNNADDAADDPFAGIED